MGDLDGSAVFVDAHEQHALFGHNEVDFLFAWDAFGDGFDETDLVRLGKDGGQVIVALCLVVCLEVDHFGGLARDDFSCVHVGLVHDKEADLVHLVGGLVGGCVGQLGREPVRRDDLVLFGGGGFEGDVEVLVGVVHLALDAEVFDLFQRHEWFQEFDGQRDVAQGMEPSLPFVGDEVFLGDLDDQGEGQGGVDARRAKGEGGLVVVVWVARVVDQKHGRLDKVFGDDGRLVGIDQDARDGGEVALEERDVGRGLKDEVFRDAGRHQHDGLGLVHPHHLHLEVLSGDGAHVCDKVAQSRAGHEAHPSAGWDVGVPLGQDPFGFGHLLNHGLLGQVSFLGLFGRGQGLGQHLALFQSMYFKLFADQVGQFLQGGRLEGHVGVSGQVAELGPCGEDF